MKLCGGPRDKRLGESLAGNSSHPPEGAAPGGGSGCAGGQQLVHTKPGGESEACAATRLCPLECPVES